jgi:hypothetical protein
MVSEEVVSEKVSQSIRSPRAVYRRYLGNELLPSLPSWVPPGKSVNSGRRD